MTIPKSEVSIPVPEVRRILDDPYEIFMEEGGSNYNLGTINNNNLKKERTHV